MAICRSGADIPPVSHAAAGRANFHLIDVTLKVDVPVPDSKGYTVAFKENEDRVGASRATYMQGRWIFVVNKILKNALLRVFLRYTLNDTSLGVMGRNDVGGDLPLFLSIGVLRELTVARDVFVIRCANEKCVVLLL